MRQRRLRSLGQSGATLLAGMGLAIGLATSHAHAAVAAREIVCPSGLKAWLVEDHGAPLITLGFRFAGGTSQDPQGLPGLAHLTADLVLQGAGDGPVDDYVRAWNDLGAEAIVEAKLESLRGTVKVLTEDRDKAGDLLAAALAAQSVNPAALEDSRSQALAEIEHDEADPLALAYAAYGKLAYGDHPLGYPGNGTRQGVALVTAADIMAFRRRVLVRENLSLAAVGDITTGDTCTWVDHVFGRLPARGEVVAMVPPAIPHAHSLDIPMPTVQAQVVFGVSLARLEPEQRLVAEVLNYTLGGSAFTSRLYRQIRDRRGLAYAIGTSLDSYGVLDEITGTFGADPEHAQEAIGLLRSEFTRLATDGPSDDEVDEAKRALSGQYLRGLIRQVDLANELTLRMALGFGADCVTTYSARVSAIKPAAVRAFARDLPWLNRLIVVTVGAAANPAAASVAAVRERSRSQESPLSEP
jgi:zinc protease